MKKRLICCIMCIFTLASLVVCPAGADALSKPMELLKAMEIISGDPDGGMRPNDLVTRAEFAKMAVLLSPHKNMVALNSKISVFTDCSALHWAAPYVKTAAENGIVEGYSDGRFDPDDNITYAQAVTVALRLLGYTNDDFGNTYPEPQLGMAQSLKINAGVGKSANEYLTRYEVSLVFANTLSTKGKNSSSNYITTLGYTLIDDCIIVATHAQDASVASDRVHTSSGEYYISDSFDTSLVGKKGSALVSGEGKLITLFTSDIKAETYAVYSVSDEYVGIYKDGSVTTLSPDGGTTAYYGVQKTTFSELCAVISTGDLITVGTASDGSINYVVAGESDFDGPYTAGTNGALPEFISVDGLSVVKNGEKSQITQIKQNDIVYHSSSLCALFVYSKKVSGTYSAATPNQDSPQSIVVGAVSYAIETPLAFSKLRSGGSYSIGDNVVLLLGKNGGVADVMGTDENGGTIGNLKAQADSYQTMTPEVALLSSLGAVSVSDNYLQNSEKEASRGEFAKMAVMSSVHRSKVSAGTKLSIFPDCTADYWATPYVKTAVENGLMSAMASGRFYPDEPITFAYAVDCALKIVGYSDSDFADWPQSRISLASSLGITDGITKAAYDSLTKAEAVTLLYNTLCCTQKTGSLKVIEAMGYEYYDDCVAIATSKESSSVPYGKILTSNGTFSFDENDFNYELPGKSGQLLVLAGKAVMFNPEKLLSAEAVIHSALPGGLALMDGDGIVSVSLPETTATYANAGKSTYARVRDTVSMGDTATIYYDENGSVEYLFVNTSSLAGPYVCTGNDWYKSVPGSGVSSRLVKGGKEVTALSANDVLYYSASQDTVYAYDNKIIGIFEDAFPSKTSPNTITVSGTEYAVGSSDVLPDGIDYGDTITLCLGRDSKAVYGYSTSTQTIAGYLVGTGVKEFKNSNDEAYTSLYATLVLADGSVIDCATDSNYESWLNYVMTITFADGKAKLSALSSGNSLSGKVDAANLKIGSAKVSDNVKILDVGYVGSSYPSVYKPLFISRLDGMSLNSKDVLYTKQENGEITELILKDATGDAFSYGVVSDANYDKGKGYSSPYTCDINGKSYTYTATVNGIQKGTFVKTALSNGKIQYLTKMTPKTVNIDSCDYTSITLSDGTKLKLAEDVVVYRLVNNFTYTLLPVSELYENLHDYSYTSVCSDADEEDGGRVRIVILKD